MRLSTTLKLAGVAALALTVALIAAVKSIDVQAYKGYLIAEVQSATGRSLTVAGPLELELGLVPRLVATGVSLGNMRHGSKPDMAHVERVEAEVALLPLLSRRVEIQRLVLVHPDILLETDAKGHGNWEFASSEAAADQGSSPPTRITAHDVAVRGGKLTWRDGVTGATRRLALDTLTLRPQGAATGALALTAKGTVDDAPFTLDGTLGALAEIGGGKPWPVKLKGSFEGALAVVDGTIGDPFAGTGLTLKFDLHGEELASLVRAVGAGEMAPVGPYKASGRLTDAGGSLGVAGLDMALGRREAGLITAKGTVKDLPRMRGLDLAMTLDSDDLEGLSALAETPLPSMGPLSVSGKLTDAKASWTLSDIKAAIGQSTVGGTLALAVGNQPRVTGTLTAKSLVLADFTTPAAKPGEVLPPKAEARPEAGRVFPDTALPLATLRAFDADLTMKAERLDLGPTVMSDVSLSLRLDGGRLTIEPAGATVGGGRIEAQATLDPQGDTATLSAKLVGQGVSLSEALKDAGPLVEGGAANLRLAVAGKGATIRAIMASLTGDALIDIGQGRIRSSAVSWGGDTLVGVLGALVPGDDTTTMQCGVVHLKVKDGVARAEKGIAIETDKMSMVGAGTIDLRNEQLDIGLTPRSRNGLGLGVGSALAEMTRVGGTLANPSVRLDELGTVRTAASVGAAVATGGLSLLGELLIDKVTTDYSPCRTALGKAGRKG